MVAIDFTAPCHYSCLADGPPNTPIRPVNGPTVPDRVHYTFVFIGEQAIDDYRKKSNDSTRRNGRSGSGHDAVAVSRIPEIRV
jgi:hypothetical protein